LSLISSFTPLYDFTKLPYRTSWGAYTIRVDKVVNQGQRLRILDKQGRTVRSVSDVFIYKVELVSLHRGTSPALHVIASSGMAHGGQTEFLFTREKGVVRNVLVFLGDNGSLYRFQDLNSDGRKEILAYSDVLAYSGTSFANSPIILMVLGWNGHEYVDRTRAFASQVRAEAKTYQRQWLQLQKQRKLSAARRPETWSEDRWMGCLAGYYGNMVAIGQEPEARRWILSQVQGRERERFMSFADEWKEKSASSDYKVSSSQKAQLAGIDDR
jgi:hypothetical protein